MSQVHSHSTQFKLSTAETVWLVTDRWLWRGLGSKAARAKTEASAICLDAGALRPCLTLHLISHYSDGNLANAIALQQEDMPVKYSINVDCKSSGEVITG